ncbi:unnamed protein product [[Candida] boidinii]|uniref:Unnamed protein product n=1 Tax=Candida boidinii TaxID=5477 RepID=A0A9W6SZD4_CANBO|nr:unnamed protein product [[Candida] boidinii]GMF63519.1 unnamed protein product [[Candida] boidinii]
MTNFTNNSSDSSQHEDPKRSAIQTDVLYEDSSKSSLERIEGEGDDEQVLENTKWTRHIWDTWGHPDKRHVEVIFKLDCTLLFLACASTFIKYLDKINLTYAYVNGLKEDIGINGNEYNYANTGYNIACMVCGFPAAYLMVKMNSKWFIILIEIGWIIVTFCQSNLLRDLLFYNHRLLLALSLVVTLPLVFGQA